jgi:hypothetical protein
MGEPPRDLGLRCCISGTSSDLAVGLTHAEDFLGSESLLVKFNGRRAAADDQVRRHAVIAIRNGFYFGCHCSSYLAFCQKTSAAWCALSVSCAGAHESQHGRKPGKTRTETAVRPLCETQKPGTGCRSPEQPGRTKMIVAKCGWLVKRRRALLESNPPRNSRPETHPDDERGLGLQRLSPHRMDRFPHASENSFHAISTASNSAGDR